MALSFLGRGFLARTWLQTATVAMMGCAGSQAVIEHPFPAREELSALANSPLRPAGEAGNTLPLAVSTWKLAGPFPTEAGSAPYKGDDALTRTVGKQLQVQKSAAVLTESLQCFARETGRFLAAHGRQPQVDLEAFIAGRCGIVPASPSIVYWLGAGTPTAEVAAKQVEGALKKVSGPAEVGAWMGAGDKGSVVVFAFGQPKVKLASVKVSREGSPEIRLRGRLLQATGWMRAHATAGSLGANRCVPTPKSAAVLPDFDLRCLLKVDDAYTVVDMTAGAPNAVMGRRVLTLVLPTRGEIPDTYTTLVLEGAQGVKNGLLAQVNAVRESLKQATLVEVPAQSKTANTLLPHFFSVSSKDDQNKLDLISLGMLAGWDVPGPIRDASFLSFYGTYGDNAPSFLAELLFFPGTRAVLLDAGARKIAFATAQSPKTRDIFGLLSTYSLFEPQDHSQTEARLLDELDRQRAAKGKKPVERAAGTERVLDPIMQKLAHGETTPLGGLQDVLQSYSDRLHRQFQGMVYSTMVIEGWQPAFEGPLADLDNLIVAAKVGFFAGRGSNWGQYVTYFVFLQA